CLARTASLPEGSFDDVLLSAVLYHAGGPMILPGALRPEEADEVTPELITRAIAVLRKSFRYIVVDLGVTITDATLALFDLSKHGGRREERPRDPAPAVQEELVPAWRAD